MEGKHELDLDNIFMIIMAGSGATCRHGWDEAVAKSVNLIQKKEGGRQRGRPGLAHGLETSKPNTRDTSAPTRLILHKQFHQLEAKH